ncbi:ABC transporter permease subunit [Candidatus Fermentibacteria bacterium]|nr:ABC transporter permease subunit [Candidatus Fermentibacteria bacterium]
MTSEKESAQTWARQLHGSLVILKKNAYLYYLKPPVLIFGVLFPLFFFLSFKMGRPVSADNIVPGMVAMALWFTATAVGPLVTPWERRAKTYERLISSPVSLHAILAGDVMSGLVFGVCFSVVPVLLGLLLTDASVASLPLLLAGIVLGALTFASLGVLLAAPPASSPSNIMLLSNLVRLPLLFVSGIFIPIAEMPVWARWIAPISPLSYASSLIRAAFGRPGYFSVRLSLILLVLFTVVLFLGACRFHRRWRVKGL